MAYYPPYLGNPYNQPIIQPYQPQQPQMQMNTMPAQQPISPISNKIYVTSIEDAMNRFAQPNSVMFYILQDETKGFEVTTNIEGKKSVRTINFAQNLPVEQAKDKECNWATAEQLLALEERLNAIEKKLPKQKKNEIVGGVENE